MTRSIVLTGFMGSGKSSVGRLAAERLGRPFVDMDVEIARRLGKPIVRIFAEDGEAVFRHAERALCAELAEREGLVIAAGGGALLDPANYSALAERTDLICLQCSVDELLNRLDGSHDRPLLEVADRRAEIQRLLEERRPIYDIIPWQIDTTHLTLEEAVRQVEAVALRRSLPVRYFTEAYTIHIAPGLLDHIGALLRREKVRLTSTLALVTNPVVGDIYAARVIQSLERMGYQALQSCRIPDGEEHKTLQTVAALYDQFTAAGMDRHSYVLALGGGVTGDIAGMAAGTYLRGVGLIQIPTTLLAMVDSSVGGKTGVDLPQGKNLVGVFKQPHTVLIDPLVLQTLAVEELRSGMAELIKHAVIADSALFDDLERGSLTLDALTKGDIVLMDWIERAVRVKIKIVEEDPFEEGRRALLNLGHTLGHALEKLSGYRLRHGEAVSIGMVAAARIAERLGMTSAHLPQRIEQVLARYGLPQRCPAQYSAHSILEAAQQDKKRKHNRLRWVLPLEIGRVEVADGVPQQVVYEVLMEMGACQD